MGPDDEGRVVYVETFRDPKPHFALKTLSLLDGVGESTVFERDGDIPLARDVALALAPGGERVAMVTRIHEGAFQYLRPELSLLDVHGGTQTFIESEVAVYRPYWFPDGRHLAIVEQRAPEAAPFTSIVDVLTGERRVLTEGIVHAVGPDGTSVLIGDRTRLKRVDAATGLVLEEQVSVPGQREPWSMPRELSVDLGAGLMLCDALPTTGVPQELVSGALGPGYAMWPVKLCDTRSGAFLTVVPYLDQQAAISFGAYEMP